MECGFKNDLSYFNTPPASTKFKSSVATPKYNFNESFEK